MKNFDIWNEKKKEINEQKDRLYFRDGEIWWVKLGINIGYETDGKSEDFTRPVLILKKYNKYSFLAIPLTSKIKLGRYYCPIGSVDGKEAIAILSQLKNIDSLRLVNKVGFVGRNIFEEIKKAVKKANSL
ncbi:type II toxin-antitoxin system PemK/MazF family toxin [Patescibacteria group bacterium]|nr:type II toxin-antitoxin system PemK/MazF family toxin [Patescibacteria group bacterium]